mgnify:CR=1 FL=1
MTAQHTTVSHWRLWVVNHEPKPLGSSNTSTSLSCPRISPKLSSTEDGSPSMALIQHRTLPVNMDPPETTNPNILHGTQPAAAILDWSVICSVLGEGERGEICK